MDNQLLTIELSNKCTPKFNTHIYIQCEVLLVRHALQRMVLIEQCSGELDC